MICRFPPCLTPLGSFDAEEAGQIKSVCLARSKKPSVSLIRKQKKYKPQKITTANLVHIKLGKAKYLVHTYIIHIELRLVI